MLPREIVDEIAHHCDLATLVTFAEVNTSCRQSAEVVCGQKLLQEFPWALRASIGRGTPSWIITALVHLNGPRGARKFIKGEPLGLTLDSDKDYDNVSFFMPPRPTGATEDSDSSENEMDVSSSESDMSSIGPDHSAPPSIRFSHLAHSTLYLMENEIVAEFPYSYSGVRLHPTYQDPVVTPTHYYVLLEEHVAIIDRDSRTAQITPIGTEGVETGEARMYTSRGRVFVNVEGGERDAELVGHGLVRHSLFWVNMTTCSLVLVLDYDSPRWPFAIIVYTDNIWLFYQPYQAFVYASGGLVHDVYVPTDINVDFGTFAGSQLDNNPRYFAVFTNSDALSCRILDLFKLKYYDINRLPFVQLAGVLEDGQVASWIVDDGADEEDSDDPFEKMDQVAEGKRCVIV